MSIKGSHTDALYENDDMLINIEVNLQKTPEKVNKNMRYVFHLALRQVKPGEKDKYKQIYQINLNLYDFFGKGEFIYKSFLMEEKGIEKRNIEIAREMLKEKIDMNLITKITGLSKEEIKKLETED